MAGLNDLINSGLLGSGQGGDVLPAYWPAAAASGNDGSTGAYLRGLLWDAAKSDAQGQPAPSNTQAPAASPDNSSAPQPPPQQAQAHGLLGHIAAGMHQALGGLFGPTPASYQAGAQPTGGDPASQQLQSQPQAPDPIAQLIAKNRPNALQSLLHAWGTGQDFNSAQADLTERNIQTRMLPAKIAADLQQAQIQSALRGRLVRALQPPPGGGTLMQASSPGAPAEGGVQTASYHGAPSGQTAQVQAGGSGLPVDRDTLAALALTGDKNAAAAWQIGAPKWSIDRGTHQMYDETSGALGRRLSNKEYVNNFLTDPNDPNAPTYIPKLPEGTMPDGKGGVIQMPGYASATAQAAGAVAGAQESAKAPFDVVTVQTPQGPVTMSKAQLAAMQGGGGGAQSPQAPPAPTAAVSAPAATQGGSRSVTPQQAMQFYIAKGYKPEQAAGIVGNLIGESGLDATRTADDGSFGLAQWTGPRLQGLFAFAKANKLDPSDPNTQLEYSHYEMGNGEKAAGSAIRNAGNVDDATAAAAGYERPAGYTPQNPRGASNFNTRLGAARQLVSGPGGVTAQPQPQNKPFIAQGTNPATQSTDQDELKTLRAAASEKRYLATQANEFVQKQGNLSTGPGYGIGIGPVNVKSIAEVLPGGHGTQLQDLDAITNRAWVHLRPQGSGSLRGPEIDSFKEAFPNLENLGQANVDIANNLNADARQAEQELAFKENWLQKNGTLTGADAAWAKQPTAHNATAGQAAPGAQPQGAPKLPAKAPSLPPRAPSLPGRQPPVQAVRDLKSDPSPQAQKEFDQVFGIGAAKRALGAA